MITSGYVYLAQIDLHKLFTHEIVCFLKYLLTVPAQNMNSII